MNNAEWVKLLRKQRERKQAEEVAKNENITDGNGKINGSDEGINAGTITDSNKEHTESSNAGGAEPEEPGNNGQLEQSSSDVE